MKKTVFTPEGCRVIQPLSNQITITGDAGVGTSSAMKALVAILGPTYRYVSGGDIMRQKAKSQGKPIEQLVSECSSDPTGEIDRALDDLLEQYGRQNHLVLEARLSHVAAEHGFHVLLTCPYGVRVYRQMYPFARKNDISVYDAATILQGKFEVRDEKDRDRFSRLYPGCQWEKEAFNLVLDTEEVGGAENVANRILMGHMEWRQAIGRTNLNWGVYA